MPDIPVSSAFDYLGVFFLLAGFFLIIAGLGIIKVKDVTITIGKRTWGFGLLLAILGIFFLLLELTNFIPSKETEISSITVTHTLAPSITSTHELEPTITITHSPTPASTLTPTSSVTATQKTVYSSPEIIHIGDQYMDGFEILVGICYEMLFQVNLPVSEFNIELETYGAEAQNPILVNGWEIAVLPPQGVKSPNEWTEARTVLLSPDSLVEGMNILKICANDVEIEADYPGDKDDFQIRNIKINIQ
jgi:hypothetical protein